jgi:hypothetical protein
MRKEMSHGDWSRPAFSAAIGLLGALMTPGAIAHHSMAMFDLAKTVEVKGVVKDWLYTNPHSFLTVSVTDASGTAKDFSFEANGPGYLVRNGWNRNSVKPGDNITVVLNPLRDGSPGGNLVEVTLPDGKKLSALVRRPPAATGTPPGATPPPAAVPTTPAGSGARP